MIRTILFANVFLASITTSAFAATNVIGGDHIASKDSILTFPIHATSDAGEQLSGMDLFLAIDPLGPIITKVDLEVGTVWEGQHTGQTDWANPVYMTPGHQPIYGINTLAGTTVPTGIVAWITIDTTGVGPGFYDLLLSQPDNGDTSVYVGGATGYYTNGTILIEPEPGSVVMCMLGAVSLGAVAFRRRLARNSVFVTTGPPSE